MDFEDAKENIQPLASGRNASVLACSLTSHSDLQKQRELLEAAINNYDGHDPLEAWYDYILWIEQSYPSGGNESGLKKVLLKCLITFEEDKRYYQDRRMIRIFIKYIDTEENPIELYQELFNSGIGTMIADLYICWAYYYDLAGNFHKADSIFRKGLELKAQPYDELEQAHKHFGFSMSQRILHQDESSKEEFMSSMRERRHALTSLRPHKKRVGSIRTGSVVKSLNPGKIKVDDERGAASLSYRNDKVQVYEDQNKNPNLSITPFPSEEHHIPVVKNIIDSVRKQENLKEPGPWTKGLKKKGNLFGNTKTHEHEMRFTILEDDKDTENNSFTKLPQYPEKYSKGILLPPNFAKKNYPQGIWKVEIIANNEIQSQGFPQYNKLFHYPKPDVEFSTEEILAHKWFVRNGKQNKFTEKCNKYFENEISVGFRMYKNFPKKNLPEKGDLKLSVFKHEILPNCKLAIKINEVYCGVESGKIYDEKQFEEILFEKIKSGKRKIKFNADETIRVEEGMDETVCFTNIVGRKSIFPSRKSMAPFPSERKTIFKTSNLGLEEQSCDAVRLDKISPVNDIQQKAERYESVIAQKISLNPSKYKGEKQIGDNMNAQGENSYGRTHLPKIFQNIVDIPNKSEESPNVDENFGPITMENLLLPKNGQLENATINSEILVTSKIIQEKQSTEVFGQNQKDQAKEKICVQNKNLDNFVIYEDPDETFKFKQPNPVKNVLQPKTPIHLLEEKVEDNINLKVPQPLEFAGDETCITANFNLLCIKPQLSSTPVSKYNLMKNFRESTNEKETNSGKKSISVGPNVLQAIEQKANDISNHSIATTVSTASPDLPIVNSFPTELFLNNCPYNLEPPPLKQLSTIMETSETNTLGTGSTKSSVDTPVTLSNYAETIKQSEKRNSVIEATKMNKSSNKSVEISKVPDDLGNSKPFQNMKNDNITDPNVFIKNLSGKYIVFEEYNTNIENEIKRQSVIKKLNSSDENEVKISKGYNNDENMEKSLIKTKSVENFASLRSDELVKPKHKPVEDISQHFNMKSIQIFEEKTETIPKIIMKRQNAITEPPQDDLYNFFVKTPERKGPTLALPLYFNPAPKINFEIEDSLTFSKLNEITLPKGPDNSKFLMKDSPYAKIAKFSSIKDCEKDISMKIPETCLISKANFDEKTEKLPTLPNLGDSTLPKLLDKQKNSSFENNNIKKLSFLSHDKMKDKTLSALENSASLSKDASIKQSYNFCENGEKKKLLFLSNEKINSSSRNSANFSKLDHLKKPDEFFDATKLENKPIDNKTMKLYNANSCFNKSIGIFEDHVPTDAFALHINSIRNSTFLSQKVLQFVSPDDIHEKSIHIKEEILDEMQPKSHLNYKKIPTTNTENTLQTKTPHFSAKYDGNGEVIAYRQIRSLEITEANSCVGNSELLTSEDTDLGRSIYFKHSLKTPTVAKHFWKDVEDDEYAEEDFVHFKPENLDQTNIFINDINVNPFSSELTKAFLENIEFTNHLQSLNSCELKRKIGMICKGDEIKIKNNTFIVSKIVGEGAFGTIYSAKETTSGKMYAIKQEKPANLWEYYICLELCSRIQNTNILPAFMAVEYALIGNNASILVSEFSPYGSFITICNSYKRTTNKNLDEYVVMILTDQILTIIDHLHALKIIHADIKPDNFILMRKLSYPSNQLAIQLIDFGISIDMELFPKNQTFMYSHTKEDFKCIEMREGRPWTYQTDLFGVAGTIHVLLFGKYMDVQKNSLSGNWGPKQHVPRYLKRNIWEPIFQSLLNIHDCNLMPNLQILRATIGEILVDKEKYVNEKVNEFNNCLN